MVIEPLRESVKPSFAAARYAKVSHERRMP